VVTSLLMIVVVLLLWAIYRIDLLQQRVERLHVKVNAIRRAVAPDAHQTDVDVADLHSVTDTIRVLKHD
jgi:hypothetical protein